MEQTIFSNEHSRIIHLQKMTFNIQHSTCSIQLEMFNINSQHTDTTNNLQYMSYNAQCSTYYLQ